MSTSPSASPQIIVREITNHVSKRWGSFEGDINGFVKHAIKDFEYTGRQDPSLEDLIEDEVQTRHYYGQSYSRKNRGLQHMAIGVSRIDGKRSRDHPNVSENMSYIKKPRLRASEPTEAVRTRVSPQIDPGYQELDRCVMDLDCLRFLNLNLSRTFCIQASEAGLIHQRQLERFQCDLLRTSARITDMAQQFTKLLRTKQQKLEVQLIFDLLDNIRRETSSDISFDLVDRISALEEYERFCEALSLQELVIRRHGRDPSRPIHNATLLRYVQLYTKSRARLESFFRCWKLEGSMLEILSAVKALRSLVPYPIFSLVSLHKGLKGLEYFCNMSSEAQSRP
ncbi:MAG: hypothetical protein M1833_000351 [Piccolia ochrophora]|nr:MAG: hypothetical protein M1833_000351 [Piccolia ochrophora]